MALQPWSPDDLKAVIVLRDAGKTSAQIAAIVNRTRSAVLGAAHRERLKTEGPAGSKRKRLEFGKGIKRPEQLTPDVSSKRFNESQEQPPTAVAVYEIKSRQCHWPLGLFQDKVDFFCGAETSNFTRSYCDAHHKRAWFPRVKKAGGCD